MASSRLLMSSSCFSIASIFRSNRYVGTCKEY